MSSCRRDKAKSGVSQAGITVAVARPSLRKAGKIHHCGELERVDANHEVIVKIFHCVFLQRLRNESPV